MELKPTALPGCWELVPSVSEDERGFFVKTFHEPDFAAKGLATHFAEEYYSYSKMSVIRGLHFHLPPHDHAKLVYCPQGAVLDAVVDLRKGSPTFGRHLMIDLDARKRNMLYIPAGLAHGFCVKSQDALMIYKTTIAYSPEHDAGVRWDSAGISWPEKAPIVSARDRGFEPLVDFKSPFIYVHPKPLLPAGED